MNVQKSDIMRAAKRVDLDKSDAICHSCANGVDLSISVYCKPCEDALYAEIDQEFWHGVDMEINHVA
jgi:hypothetical protein